MISVSDFSPDIENDPEKMASLMARGYDFAIVGTITHCVGFQLTESSGGSDFGAAGALFDAVSNPRIVGAKVEYNPIKVIDLKKQKVIWSDAIEYSYEKQDTFYRGPYAYAMDGIKGASNKFIAELIIILDKEYR